MLNLKIPSRTKRKKNHCLEILPKRIKETPSEIIVDKKKKVSPQNSAIAILAHDKNLNLQPLFLSHLSLSHSRKRSGIRKFPGPAASRPCERNASLNSVYEML